MNYEEKQYDCNNNLLILEYKLIREYAKTNSNYETLKTNLYDILNPNRMFSIYLYCYLNILHIMFLLKASFRNNHLFLFLKIKQGLCDLE